MNRQQNANDHFGNSNGTDQYYRDTRSGLLYTDGVRSLVTTCKAWWLLDLIISHQLNPQVRQQPFQVWDLTLTADDSFKAICTDGNDNTITSQDIPFSDFPYEKATIWLSEGIILLPREY